MSRESDSQSNLPVDDRICCVGVKVWSYRGHYFVLSLSFDGPRTALRLPQLNNVTLMRTKTRRKIVFPSKPKSKVLVLLHRLERHAEASRVLFLTIEVQGNVVSMCCYQADVFAPKTVCFRIRKEVQQQ